MVYGKLEVYWPDGPVDNYPLDKATTAIGRSSGNDIVLDTSSISRYHITLTHQDQDVILQDLESANGTYLDGERLIANHLYPLHGGEEVQIGDLRLIFQPKPTITADSTQPVRAADTSQNIETADQTFRIELEAPPQAVTPGAHVQAILDIYNLGTTSDHYYVEVEGVPQEWIRIDRPELELEASAQATIGLTFKPLRRSESKPGDYTVLVRVRAHSTIDKPVEAKMPLRVLSFGGFGIVLTTPRVDSNTPFEIHMHNQGSALLPLAISGVSSNSLLSFDIRPTTVTLAPGEHRIVTGKIQLKRSRLFGTAQDHPFDVLVRSQDAANFLVAVPGKFVERPNLPGWVLGAGVLAILLLATVAVLGFAFVSRPRAAQIVSLSVVPLSMLRYVHQSMTVSWQVTNATNISLEYQGLDSLEANPLTYTPNGQTTLAGIPTDPLLITLVALGEDGQPVRSTQTVAVTNPQCTVVEAAPSYHGPGVSYGQADSLAAGIAVTPDRRDDTAQWIRVSDSKAWLPASSLACAGFTVAALMPVAGPEIPPSPTAIPSPTFVPTAAPTERVF